MENKNIENKEMKNMKLAFILNFCFAILEFIGGIYTNSISIMSDALHDLGDSFAIGTGIFFKSISLKRPNIKYTYGYGRYSVVGALINLIILSVGSVLIIINSIPRLFMVEEVNHSGMFIFAILGILVNLIGAIKTSHSHDISEKVINLHLLEDLFGWILVLITSIAIGLWNVYILDPILSLILAGFIIINVIKNLKTIMNIILEKIPTNVDINHIKKEIISYDGVIDMHHIHIWTIEGNYNYLTAHIYIDKNMSNDSEELLKNEIKHRLLHLNINHSTLEFETELCDEKKCNVKLDTDMHHLHHHHH